MAANKVYLVHVGALPEHERIILKLILSVSQHTRGRTHGYQFTEAPDADIAIGTAEARPPAGARGTLLVGGETGGAEPSLMRPLIATRVLAALDAIVKATDAATAEPAPAPVTPTTETQSVRYVAPIAFNISEEEASELAIVDDETLANPANRAAVSPHEAREPDPPSYAVGFAPAQIRPLHASVRRGETAEPVQARVLVVDDSPSVRKQLELELDFFAVHADYAADAAAAERLLDAHRYDVAFLDVVLPDSDGFSICKRIKAVHRDTAVIMLTGKASHADKVRGALAGCNAYLIKPVGRVTFQNTVKDYLDVATRASAMGG